HEVDAGAITTKTFRNWRRSMTGLAIAGILTSGLIIFMLINGAQSTTALQDRQVQQQSALIDQLRNAREVVVMAEVLRQASEELTQRGDSSLSEGTIARIASVSARLQPYRSWQGDSLAEKPFSPERGQLLLTLVNLPLDSLTWARVKANTTFAGADLRGMKLPETNLSGANLESANFTDADLNHTNLSATNLKDAWLGRALLNHASLSRADLRRANLGGAQMNAADFSRSNLDGVNLQRAVAREANFHRASLQFGQLDGAFLIDANLSRVNLIRTTLHQANLTGANLSRSNLRLTSWTETHLTGADLRFAGLGQADWLEQLETWRVVGAQAIRETYAVEADTTERWRGVKYELVKVEASP
ncbi:MAG: pentapeptide repeat-containing protein, partial [Bacteroidota bacterium]